MKLFEGKTGLVMGVANHKSIATHIAKELSDHGANLAFSYLDEGKMKSRVEKAIEGLNCAFLHPCNVNSDESIDNFFSALKEKFGKIDFLVHSIAFAPLEDIKCPTIQASRAGFLTAMETSVYSFIQTARKASEMMNEGGSITTLSYFGSEKVVTGYNLMGVAKAALEASVRYLAFDLGPKNIRVNAISAGIVKTLAASAIGDFQDMLNLDAAINPMHRNITPTQVAQSSLFLLSDLASGITGEILHTDNGYHMMGGPGRALDFWKLRPRDFPIE